MPLARGLPPSHLCYGTLSEKCRALWKLVGIRKKVQEEYDWYQVSGYGILKQCGKPFATFDGG